MPLKARVRTPASYLAVENVTVHNLKNVSVNIPTGVLTVVTGVAGSGKSTLIHQAFLKQHPGAIVIDQSCVTANLDVIRQQTGSSTSAPRAATPGAGCSSRGRPTR